MKLVKRVTGFLSEVVVELKKSSWPTRSELIDSTTMVIVTVFILGMFVAFADFVFMRIVGVLIHGF